MILPPLHMASMILNMSGSGSDNEPLLLCFPNRPDSCLRTQRFSLVKVGMYIFMLSIIFMTVFGNLLVIISIAHFRHLQSPTNFMILSLALGDCMLGCLIMPFSMVRSVEGCWFLGDTACRVHSSLDATLCLISILHLCLVAIERYLAICKPLTYKMTVTNGSATVCISITWIVSFAYSFGIFFSNVTSAGLDLLLLKPCFGSCVLFFNKQWAVLVPLTTFFLPGGVMSSLYVKVFCVARKQAKVISRILTVVTSREVKSRSSEQSERKAAKTLGIVVGVFLICWLPYFIATIIDAYMDFSTPLEVFNALVWVAYMNSTFNPLIYSFFYPSFQKAFKVIVSKYVCRLSNN